MKLNRPHKILTRGYVVVQEHLEMCPQKNSVAQTIKKMKETTVSGAQKETCNVQCDEQWSDEEATYDPRIKLATENVIRVDKKLMPKAERKAFAESERIRLNALRNKK